MKKLKFLTDYYPVYLDLQDFSDAGTTIPGQPSMYSASSLIELSFQYSLTPFQTVVLLVKNSFEGHLLMTFNLRPLELYENGLCPLIEKENLLSSFYENFEEYMAGLMQGWEQICNKETGLDKVDFGSLIRYILSNQILLFPVSVLKSEISQFIGLSTSTRSGIQNHLDLVITVQKTFEQYIRIRQINERYEEYYKEYLSQIRMKEDVLMHYERMLFFAHEPDIQNEDQLSARMYKYLIESEMAKDIHRSPNKSDKEGDSGVSENMQRIKKRNRSLFAEISKNCGEILIKPESTAQFSELYDILQDAMALHTEDTSTPDEAILKLLRLSHLLTNVIIYRKIKNLSVFGDFLPESLFQSLAVKFSDEDFITFRKNLELRLTSYRTRSFSESKTIFIQDQAVTKVHEIWLQEQIKFLENKISEIQQEIKQIIRQKSGVSS